MEERTPRVDVARAPRAGLAVAALLVATGLAALAWAWRCDVRYCERNLLAQYAVLGPREVLVARAWRIAGFVVGGLAIAAAPWAGRWVARRGAGESAAAFARIGVALVASLVASELALRALHLPRPFDRSFRTEVRIGERDPRYGWRYVASQTSVLHHGVRDIEYAIDAAHDRAPTSAHAIDYDAPTILFLGESIVAGHGLAWDETFPAIVERELGIQVVNLGVHGYGLDQAYLRLYDELPRFTRPAMVVSLYYLPMIERLEDRAHPALAFDGDAPRVVERGAMDDLRLVRAWRAVQPHWGDAPIALAAQIVRATERLAKGRGAKAIFVAPSPSWPRPDAYLIDELFTRQGLEVLDGDVRWAFLEKDNHPDAATHRRIADEVIAAARRALASR